jgi:hypothetical protein
MLPNFLEALLVQNAVLQLALKLTSTTISDTNSSSEFFSLNNACIATLLDTTQWQQHRCLPTIQHAFLLMQCVTI